MALSTRMNNSLTSARVVYIDNMNQINDIDRCNATSLEVYRGREQVINITHDGFSLSDNGIIEV